MTNYRWVVCAMLFFATTVNYLDRQVLSLTFEDFIRPEFHWTDSHYGNITGIFSLFYAIAMLIAGKFVDWMGTKKGFISVKPNCSIQSYVPALTPLRKYGIKEVVATTYQAISGAGKTFNEWPEMIENIIPYIGGEEEKSEKEPLRIWGYIDEEKGVNTVEEALQGASDIIAEDLSDSAEIRKALRDLVMRRCVFTCKAVDGAEEEGVYKLYYDFSQPISRLLDHQILAINRGEKEDILKPNVALVGNEGAAPDRGCE